MWVLRQEVGLCAVGNDPVETENPETGVGGDNGRSIVFETMRGNGLWSPSGGVTLRKQRGLFIHFSSRRVRACMDRRRIGGSVRTWRGEVVFLDSHLPVDISAWESCCNSNSTFPRGMLLFPSLPKPSYPSGFTLFLNSISIFPVTNAPNHSYHKRLSSLLQHPTVVSLLSIPYASSPWH